MTVIGYIKQGGLNMKRILFVVFFLSAFASCQTTHQGSLTWIASTTPNVTYNVYRSIGTLANPGTFSIVKSGIAGLSFVDTPLQSGTTYCWQVTAVSGTTLESEPLGPACGVTGKDKANSPTGLGLVIQ